MSLTQINKAGLDEIALDHVFTIGAYGNSAYTFQGEGLNGTVNNPTLYLTRGKTYRFENGSGGHPIRIQSTSGASGTAYNTGVTNNAGSGTVIVEVQHDAPDVLYYQCTSHTAMNGILYITGALADGGVTTAKIADDAVTGTKIADGAINAVSMFSDAVVQEAKIQGSAVTTSKIANSAVNTAKIADDAVTSAKIADNAVVRAAINAEAVSTSKIEGLAVTTAKIAADAVTGAKIADDAVGNEHLADNCVNTVQIANLQVTNGKLAADAVTTAKIANSAVTNSKLGDDCVTGSRIADNAVATEHITDQAVTLAKLPHGTSSNDGKFLRANNGADPTFETVTGTTINNNADNRVITGSGSANTLNGESNVTIDSSARMTVSSTAHGDALTLSSGGSTYGGSLHLTGTGSPNQDYVIAVGGGDNAYVTGRGLLIRDITNSANRIGILTNGNLQIHDGNLQVANGHGIDFSSHSQVGSNNTSTGALLDDYEEGYWTPRIQGTTGAGTASYNTAYGRYVKIGNFVHISGNLNWTQGSAGGEMQIGNLPFTPVANNEGIGNMMGHVLDTHSAVNICVYAGAGVYYAYLYQTRDNQGWITVNYDNDGAIIFNVAFRVA